MHVIYTICNGLLNRTPYFISTLSIKKANHKKKTTTKQTPKNWCRHATMKMYQRLEMLESIYV